MEVLVHDWCLSVTFATEMRAAKGKTIDVHEFGILAFEKYA